MSKSDYWDEKENEKYQKMKVEVELENIDFERMKKISKITNKIIKAICIPAAIIGIITFILTFLGVIWYWKGLNEAYDPDVVKNLSNLYDEKFKVISYEEKENKQEIYKVVPKDNKNIVGTIYKKGARTANDYQDQVLKYFVENILDEDIRSKITVEEKYNKVSEDSDIMILSYHTFLDVEKIEQIDEYAEIMQKISQIANNQNKRVYAFITWGSWIRIGNYYSNVQYDEYRNIEDTKELEKNGYLTYINKNGLNTENIQE
ncbi:MAG: hypothetical protein ACI4VQ_07835 [Clostridia bacterium]